MLQTADTEGVGVQKFNVSYTYFLSLIGVREHVSLLLPYGAVIVTDMACFVDGA